MKFLILLTSSLFVYSFKVNPNRNRPSHTVSKLSNTNTNVIKLDVNRFIKYNLIAVGLAIGSNFLGVTSTIMSNTNPDFFRTLKLDQLYSIGGYQRYLDSNDQYEFVYPSNWQVDEAVLVARQVKREKPAMLTTSRQTLRPDVAFTKPGSNNKENISVLKSKVLPGFSLRGTLGAPEEAGPKLMEMIAPPSSGKTYTLINMSKKIKETEMSPSAYVIEYNIQKGETLNQHCISVITYRKETNNLFTMTTMAPENEWIREAPVINTIADSFHLF